MKIGIYGDSYAASNSPNATKWFELVAEKLEKDVDNKPQKKSLFSFFKKKNNFLYDVKYGEKNSLVLHSRAASSFFYTYNKFLQTHHEQDLNIVLVTTPTRYTKTVNLTSVKFNHVITSEQHIDSLMNLYANKLTPGDKNKLIYLRGWFKSIDEDYHNEATDLMLEKMENLNKNTIFFPSFPCALISKEREHRHGLDRDKHFMHSFWIRQLELLNIKQSNDFNAPETENLCGHLGPEFNEFFANMVVNKIKTGKWNSDGLLDVKLQHSLPFYYKVENL